MKGSKFGGLGRGFDRWRGILQLRLSFVSTSNVAHCFRVLEASIFDITRDSRLGLKRRYSGLESTSGRVELLMQSIVSPSPRQKDGAAPSLELQPLHLGDCQMETRKELEKEQQTTLR